MRRHAWFVPCVVALCAPAPAIAQPASQVVVMWGDEAPPPGTVTSVDMQGVSVMMGDGTSVLLDWTRVRDVRGARGEQFEPLRDDARAVWRAGVRLRRGDLVNAEPLLEALFARYGSHAGATSSFVAGGLLRCRLAAGARAPAIAPWLGVLRGEGWSPGEALGDASDLSIDGETGLSPALAPVWLDDEQSAWLARVGASPAPIEGARPGAQRMRLAALSALYHVSARFEQEPGDREAIERELDALFAQIEPETLREPGIALVQEIVLARVGNDEQRAAARTALGARLRRRPPPWTESWIRVALGRSMILESDAEVRRRGVIQLLHIPSRFEQETPELASIALANAAVTMRSLGDQASAGALRRELLDRFPGSEGARWHAITEWAPGEGVSRTGRRHRDTRSDLALTPEGNGRS